MRQRPKRRKTPENTYTKRKVTFLLYVGVIGAFLPYILSMFDKDPVEAIGLAWITEIVAVILGYLTKSYHETKQEKKQDLDDFKAAMRYGAMENGLGDDEDEYG